MQKEAKVTNVQGDGMFKDMYKFDIELDNGDSGKVYKKGNNAGVQIGETITYTINDKGTLQIQTGYEKRFPEKFPDKGYDIRRERSIVRQSSLSTATDFLIATKGDKATEGDLFLLATKLIAFCMDDRTPEDPEETKNEDNAPF
mgnify:CR=1 FL=1